MDEQQQYISLDDATKQLGVARGTIHYYLRRLQIKTIKFPLDRNAYLKIEDFQTIKELKELAGKRSTGSAA